MLLLMMVIYIKAQLCNLYPFNPSACIQTLDLSCIQVIILGQYSYYTNSCEQTNSQILGCEPNLNQKACVSQLLRNQSPCQCNSKNNLGIFDGRCQNAQEHHYRKYGCSKLFSYHACLAQQINLCTWKNGQCQDHIFESQECSKQLQVSYQVCSIMESTTCYNAGVDGNYQCKEQLNINKVFCQENGLNKRGCMSIMTPNQYCIFTKKCDNIRNFGQATCDLNLNQQACLRITKEGQKCQWRQNQCVSIQVTQECKYYQLVNQNVCSTVDDECYFNNGECQKPTQNFDSCGVQGLSKKSCFKVDSICQFNGKCQIAQQLNILRCDSGLNKRACLNIQTANQYCQWDNTNNQCIYVNISINTKSNLSDVNGNLCQAIFSQPCKYNSQQYKCELSELNDSCSTPYLNLLGCIAITKYAEYCQWIDGQCTNIIITKYLTKCSQLTFANPNSCQSVYNQDINEQNCYFDEKRQGCNSFIDKSTTLNCLTPGLNEVGCTNIRTKGQVCRFLKNECISIVDSAQIQSVPCIDVRSVNPISCSLVLFNGQHCKYNQESRSCVTSVDLYKDNCQTEGLNNFGCAALLSVQCYYDSDDQICKELPKDNQLADVLSKLDCVQSYPSRLACLQITKTNQLCNWIRYKFQCKDLQVVPWNFCKDYTQVNPNVCASVNVQNPNLDNRGYCIFDNVNYECTTTDQICPTPCCEDQKGINAHVCSRYSSPDHYCYFGSDLRCHEMVLEFNSDTYASKFISDNQLKCESLNYKSCKLSTWSKQQLCLQQLDDRCHNVDFTKLDDYSPFFSPDGRFSKYTCIATQKPDVYFRYGLDGNCIQVQIDEQFSCQTPDININICTRLTTGYCRWDIQNLECIDLVNPQSCDGSFNQNACNNQQNPCIFNMITNRCSKQHSPNSEYGCSYYSRTNNLTVSQLVCSQINKLGEACLYNQQTYECFKSNTESSQCNVAGSNQYYCYSQTQLYCVWNGSLNQCQDVPLVPDPTVSFGCSQNVNKQLCLSIKNSACAWDTINLTCIDVPYDVNLSCSSFQNTNFLYNIKSCTQVTLQGSFCHWDNYRCKITNNYIYSCTQPPMNINSCKFFTRTSLCLFDGSCQEYQGSLDIQCELPGISLQLCSSITKQPCKYFNQQQTCQQISIQNAKCSDLIDGNNYNRLSCISISQNVGLNSLLNYSVCGVEYCGYEKYCYWDPNTFTCNIAILAYSIITYTPTITISYDPDDTKKLKPIETVSVIETCNKYQNIFNFCDINLSKAICLELVQNTCYFDLQKGGCLQLVGQENSIISCEQANQFACSKITTPGLLCITQNRVPDGCQNQQQQQCSTLSLQYGVEDCSNYSSDLVQVNSLVCSNLSGSCYWNGFQCATFIDAYCDLAGLSIDPCIQLGCDIGPPCTKPLEQEITSCEAIPNSLPIQQQQDICIKLIIDDEDSSQASICGWDPIHNQCFRFGIEYECQELAQFVQGRQVCIQYSTKGNQGCVWKDNQCQLLVSTVYYCSDLNQYACLQLTEGVSCIWIDNSCQQKTADLIGTYTNCEIANKQACQYIGSNCWVQNDLCIQSLKDTTCSNIKKYKGNIFACQAVSKSGQSCQWNQQQGYCDDSQRQNLTCDTPGLNNLACFKNTQGLCVFTTKCESITTTDYSCLNSNYNLCLINTSYPCYWSKQNTCNQVAYKSDATCSDFYSVGSDFVNPLTCAMIQKPKQTCAYYQSSDKQSCISIQSGDCSTIGINQLGCLTVTTQSCQFDMQSLKCFEVQDYNQDCNMGFNKYACIKLTKQICYYNQQCLTYDFGLVTPLNVIQLTSQYEYNYKVCQQIDMPNTFLYYDPNTFKCVQYNGDQSLKCSQQGLNLQGCLYKTSQNCMFENGQCQIVQYSNLAIYDCQQFRLNLISCMRINQYTCKFEGSQCQPTLLTDDCHSLSNKVVNLLSCSIQTSVPCSYDVVNHKCIVQTSNDLQCSTVGLNQLGCLQNTINQRCIFQNNMCADGIQSNYICDDVINIKNCASVSVAGQYCIFDQICKQQNQSQLQICLKSFKNNPQSCPKATDQPCSYDYIHFTCQIATGIEDCLIDKTLNELACKQNKGPSICYWNGESCVGQNVQLNNKLCTDSINLNFCTSLTTTNQYCQFQTQCQNLNQMNSNNLCEWLTNINRYEFCEYTQDGPCMYDKNIHSCIKLGLTDFVSSCQRGLNEKACLNNVKESCLFQQFCYSSQQISVCEQAQSQIVCLGLTSLFCAWKNNQCQTFDPSNIPCSQISFNVVPIVCYQSQQIPPYVCAYDTVQQNCYEIQPLQCSDINERNSCQLFSTQPCLWINNQCQFTQFSIGGSSCSDVGTIGTDRACRDINKYGQFCKYYSRTLTCAFIDEFVSCDDPVNYNSCVTQTVKQCQWVIQTAQVQLVMYQYGNCQPITDISNVGCSQNLSFLACVGVTKINQFCYFHDQQCLKLQVPKQFDLHDLVLINQNICALVTTVPAQYDNDLFACQLLKDLNCNTKGINRLGCISILTQRCRWNEDSYQCTQDIIDLNKSCIDLNVSQQICQQCTGIPVQFQDGNCVQININAKCSDPGVNKAGCLKITSQPCKWIDDSCQYYQPIGQCEQFDVNKMVCALNTQENCKFDGISKCILADNNENCETVGLNVHRCIQLNGCVFNQGCHNYDNSKMKCLDIGQASPDVCALAMDSCKYDPITLSCIKPSLNDPCNTLGFSQFACQSQFDCQFSNSQCECSLIKDRYPQCDLIKSEEQCQQQTHCIMDEIRYENGYLQTCRDLTCQDYQTCQGSYLYGLPCYLDRDATCQLAKDCNSINSNNCNITIQGQLCILDNNKCTDLICENLQQFCPSDYCNLIKGECSTLKCDLLQEIPCSNRTDCYWNEQQCYKQGLCNLNDKDQCLFAREENQQCGWIDKYQLCTNSPCRYMGSNKNDCQGVQTETQTCVILGNQSCVACEEITDTCTCLQNKGYCDLQQKTNKCISLQCNSYKLYNCPDSCRISNDLCVPECNRLYNLQLCLQGQDCQWNNQLNKCYELIIPDQMVEQILPEYNYGTILFPVLCELFL